MLFLTDWVRMESGPTCTGPHLPSSPLPSRRDREGRDRDGTRPGTPPPPSPPAPPASSPTLASSSCQSHHHSSISITLALFPPLAKNIENLLLPFRKQTLFDDVRFLSEGSLHCGWLEVALGRGKLISGRESESEPGLPIRMSCVLWLCACAVGGGRGFWICLRRLLFDGLQEPGQQLIRMKFSLSFTWRFLVDLKCFLWSHLDGFIHLDKI